MINHIRHLLVNADGVPGLRKVEDRPTDDALRLFGITGSGPDGAVVDALLPLALSPDLASFREAFDPRTTPSEHGSVYRHDYTACDDVRCASLLLNGIYQKVLGPEGWWTLANLFSHPDPAVQGVLSDLRAAARSMDSAYALGAVLIVCAYRRLILQEGVE